MCRPPRRSRYRLLAGLTGVALVAAACTGGGGKAAVPTTPPPTTVAPPPGHQQLAMIVLQPGDLPRGWSAKPATPPADPTAETTAFDQCMGVPSAVADVVAMAHSPQFVKGTAAITSSATSFETRHDVLADGAALVNPKASACLEELDRARLASALPSDARIRTYSVKVTPGNGGGATNILATAVSTVSFTSSGHTLTLNDHTVYLVAPRIETRIDFYTTTEAIPAAVEAAIVNKVSVRVAFGS